MNENQNNGAMLAALGYSVPFALPQRLEPITNTKYTVQRTQYDPNKLKGLMEALNKPRAVMSAGETIANALAQYPEARSFTGGFGEEIINPWGEALSSFARGFGTVYGARKAAEREAAQQAREDAIKAAQIALDADKRVISNETENTSIKLNNDPTIKAQQAAEEATRQLATTAYVKLNPNLPKDIRDNADSFNYVARESDIGGRTPEGGTTGMVERAVASIAKTRLGDERSAKRSELLQQMTQYVSAVTNLAREGGATGQMMNSDKEGQRALQIMSNPSAYSASELAAAAETLIDLYNRMLAVKGMPSVQEGYNQVTQMVDAQKPQVKQEKDPWAKYRQ